MKRIIALLLLLCLALGLCACTSVQEQPTTEPTTAPTAAPTTEPTEPEPNYFITVQDTDNNPLAGAIVQMCKLGDDGSCTPATTPTDAEGKVSFALEEHDYKVSFIVLPAGYTYTDDVQEFYFEEGSNELVIYLKKA